MEKKVAISVKNISKTFHVPHERSTSMKQAMVNIIRGNRGYSEFNVLKGVSFDIYEGEFFGIVGRNGCGKSTLLKILAKIYTYDSGKLEINGKISPFLELGVGFNPELTGRENVFLNGAILGLNRKEIEDKYEEIVEFSELEEFMDQRLKNYSSGMQVRLAFSVAIHAHAPIILLDEVLAVGDSKFQKKCQEVFADLKAQGRTIVFVSHSMQAVKTFCDRMIVISKGEIIYNGDPREGTNIYENLNLNDDNKDILNLDKNTLIKKAKINGKERFNSIDFNKEVEVEFLVDQKGKSRIEADTHIAVFDENGARVIFSSSMENDKSYVVDGKIPIKINLGKNFLPGRYRVAFSLHKKRGGEQLYGNPEILDFEVLSYIPSLETENALVKWS